MSTQVKRAAIAALAVAIILAPRLFAHEITVKGTVAAVEAKRLQVTTGQEKKNEAAGWYGIDAKTKIVRDKTTVTFEQARIKVGERVVVLVDHQASGVMKALEIRLAAQ
jgi:uncharacterized membrane protein